MADTEQLCLLDSGFISTKTKAVVTFTQQSSLDKIISGVKLNKKITPSQKTSVYNAEVDALYKSFLEDPTRANDIVFVSDLIECTFRAFDCHIINKWLSLQNKNNALSDLHIKFLKDCFDYAFFAKSRSINIMSWSRMLDDTHAEASKRTLQIDLRDYLGTSADNQLTPPSTTVSTLIFEWLKRPNGVADLIHTLNIIFGKHIKV